MTFFDRGGTDTSGVDLTQFDQERLRHTLNGGPDGVRALVSALAPYVQARVSRVLSRHRSRGGRSFQQEVDDLCQEAFVELFERDARTLRSWDPARGASLPVFSQIVAERVVLSVLRSGRRNPWTEEPRDDIESAADSDQRPDRRAAKRETLVRVLDRLKEELSPRGYELFHALCIEERDVQTICAQFAMNEGAVYAWRSRLGKRIRAILEELEPPSDPKLQRAIIKEARE